MADFGSPKPSFKPYVFGSAAFGAGLLSISQLPGVLPHSELPIFLIYWTFLSIGLYFYHWRFLPVSGFAQALRLVWGMFLAALFIATVGLEIHHYLMKSEAQTDRYQSAQFYWHIMMLWSVQLSWLVIIFATAQARALYKIRLSSAGVDEHLERALFRIKAGYVGHHFISRVLKKVAEEANTQNDEAIGMVEDLGQLMRFALETSQKGAINLSEEIIPLEIFCNLYNRLVFAEKPQLKLEVHPHPENDVLPMAIYGLIAYVLTKAADTVVLPDRWAIEVVVDCQDEAVMCSIDFIAANADIEIEKGDFLSHINDEVIDTMRLRLEQGYQCGSYIAVAEQPHLSFKLVIPYLK